MVVDEQVVVVREEILAEARENARGTVNAENATTVTKSGSLMAQN